jgi:hypothetical protein
MKRGLGVFGKEYEYMFKNDLHSKLSVDYRILERMILIDRDSVDELYNIKNLLVEISLEQHELFEFSRSFRGNTENDSVKNVLKFTKDIVNSYTNPFYEMDFGGTEKEIIARGTDWCTDISRVGCVILKCLGIPCRIAVLANVNVAYNGHTVCEAYVNGTYTMCDFTYGISGLDNNDTSVWELINNPNKVIKIYQHSKDELDLDYIKGLFTKAALYEYNIEETHNYTISKPNEYYLKMMSLCHNETWLLGEK